jgi:hypothetical protein
LRTSPPADHERRLQEEELREAASHV